METIQLTPNFSICRILNGMWQVAGGHGEIDYDSAISQMLEYNENGFNTWDMADIYGPAESFYGDFRNEIENKKGKNELAKALKIPVYTLKARLLSATIKLGEIPPQFAKKRASKKVSKAIKRKHYDTVRISGKAGVSKRVIIPQQIFQELNWNKGDNIVIRRSGKNKIIIEKSAN